MTRLNPKWNSIAILGAGGKMGRGIALLILKAQCNTQCAIHCIDPSKSALKELKIYLTQQLEKATEKDRQLPTDYPERCLQNAHFSTDITSAGGCTLALEAASENLELKIKLLSQLRTIAAPDCDIFTNTSSLPICELDEAAQLQGRLLGFHFYNPPPVQRLVELIRSTRTKDEVHSRGIELGHALGKTLVPSNDVAGFIGNGHFMRDLLFACGLVTELTPLYGLASSLVLIDNVSRDFLVRPMGIFQLADYVGLDVCQRILEVMNERIPHETLHSDLLDQLLSAGIKGGQDVNGAQKDGIFTYIKGTRSSIYDLDRGSYVEMSADTDSLGALPSSWKPWKELLKQDDRLERIREYFTDLSQSTSLGMDLAARYLAASEKIAQELVDKEVAASLEDVGQVLKLGFFHLYGPEEKLSELFPDKARG